MRVIANFSGLLGSTTNAFIHCCDFHPVTGVAGPATPFAAGFPEGVTSGSYDHTFNMTLTSSYNSPFLTANGGFPGLAFNSLITGIDSGQAYFSIHTAVFEGGEIAGTFTAVPGPAVGAGVPGLALAICGLILWRRKQLAQQAL